jgi:hypothetical protein
MANSRDFTGKNRKFTGTKGIVTPKGTTGERVGSESGELRFNTTTELMEYYDGNQWKPIDAPPSILSVTTNDSTGSATVLNADGSTLYTVTINGGNFGTGLNVQFIGNTGTIYTAGNITRVSASQITCTTLSSMGAADDPYDVKVTNVSGLSIESLDALTFNAPPVFVNATQAFSVFVGDVITGSTINVSATDAESNTITYSIASGSLPSGLTISSSTGYITGTVGGSQGNFSFVVRASTTEGAVERQYSIGTKELPSGGTITTSGNTKIHSFTTSGSFVNPKNNLVTSYLVVAGGGGGGNVSNVTGGGGAGGMRTGSLTISNGTKTVTVGAGGAKGALGLDSVYDSITSLGGGHGGGEGSGGQSGGSGGGGTYLNNGGAGTVGQGNNGGNGGQVGNIHPAGGGGGAGAPGATGVNGSAAAGAGGAGAANSLSGSSVTYAGGAGGGAWVGSSAASAGGSGGGGNGGYHSADGSATPGTNGLGGGGGGGWNSGQSQSGGSGVVIITYDVTTI